MAMTAVRSLHEAAADLAPAGRVLRLAADGLNALAAGLDSRFSRALDLLAGVGWAVQDGRLAPRDSAFALIELFLGGALRRSAPS